MCVCLSAGQSATWSVCAVLTVLYRFVQELLGTTGGDPANKRAEHAASLRTFLEEHNECSELALPVWIAGYGSHDNAQGRGGPENEQPPVWIDVSRQYENSPSYKAGSLYGGSAKLRKRERGHCLDQLMRLLDVGHLPAAKYKSVQSKTQLFW